MSSSPQDAPLVRVLDGRVLAGVCDGLSARWDVPASRVRAGFALTTPLFGLGALAYLALWLLLPAEGEGDEPAGSRGIVTIAGVAGVLVGLGALATAGATAALLGFGWVVAVVAGAVVVGVLACWPRLGPAWALLPVAALVVPSLALAAGDVSVDRRTADRVVAPRSTADLPPELSSDLAPLLVDLRRMRLPARGTIRLEVRSGLRRTVVALPHDRCVRLRVTTHEQPLLLRALSRTTDLVSQGTTYVRGRGTTGAGTQRDPSGPARRGPTLALDLTSAGGDVVVRDYPDGVDPLALPDEDDGDGAGPCAVRGRRATS